MRIYTAMLASAALSLPQAAQAQSLPQPVIEKSQQADPLIYDAQLAKLDVNGRFELWLQGRNLAPDDLAHPSNSGYVHLYVRGVSSDNKAGGWIGCGEDGPCKVYGSTAKSGIPLGIDPDFYLRSPGSHLQFKLWVSLGPTSSADPAGAGSLTSDWSPVFTVDRALAGAVKAVPPPTPPTIQRVTPALFEIMPGRAIDWTVLVYGDHLCGGNVAVLLDGGEVARPGGCSGVDVNGAYLPAHTSLLKFVLPEGYRRAGDYTVTLRASDGDSNPVHLVVKYPQMTPIERPTVSPQFNQTIRPGIIRPPVRPN